MMLRISTTTVESFSRYLHSENDDEQKLIRQIMKLEPKSEYMKLGSAFHDIIEDPHAKLDHDKRVFVSDGIEFSFDCITKVYKEIDYSFPFEHKTEKIYMVDGQEISVVAKVDQLKARYVQEFKTCWSQFDIENYTGSYQWKFYADIYDALRVDYLVACLNNEQPITLKELHKFMVYPYPDMQKDIVRILGEMAEWISFRNLEKWFQPKEVSTAVI